MRSATKVTVSTLGILLGIAGIEHGIGETLQGNIAPSGIMFPSWPDSAFFRIVGGEPAMTVCTSVRRSCRTCRVSILSTRAFFRIYSPAHITLIDPLGRRTGFEPLSGGEVNEIPGALYTGTEAQIESVTVAGLGSSEGWRLLVTGYASGAYTLETGYLDARTRNWETHATTSEGKVDEFPVHPPNYPSYLPLLLR